jgi:hypothetical protein
MTHQINKSRLFALFAILAVTLTTLACGLDLGNSDDAESLQLEQTRVALQQTQIALEALEQEAPTEEPVVVTEEPDEPVVQPDVSYEGVSFSFDDNIAASISSETIPGQNMGEDYMPGETYPTYTKFSFNDYAIGDHFHTPVIAVYPVSEYRAISTSASDAIDNLQLTLANQPSGGSLSHLPFLPIWNAAQMFSAKVSYFDFQSGSGVRYLTMYGQAVYPVDNQNLFYTYQGLTDDGQYYISAVLPVVNMGLPNDGSSVIGDWFEFDQNWDNYIADMLDWLNGQDGNNFFPSLASLDEMMASFQVNK